MNHLAVSIQVNAEIVMVDYTCMQYDEMIFLHVECQRNAIAAAKVYSERFPRDRHPTHEITIGALHCLRETASVTPRSRRSKRAVRRTLKEVLEFALLNIHN